MKNNYSKRTMALIVTVLGCIIFGATASMAPKNHVRVSVTPGTVMLPSFLPASFGVARTAAL